MTERIVVGVDSSPSSDRAIEYAAVDAVRRNATLRLVHAFAWPYLHAPLGPAPGAPEDGGLRHQAESVLSQACDRAATAFGEAGGGDLKIDSELVSGFPAAVLIAESRHAAAVVVGDRGLGGFAGLLLGSTATQLITHAHAPVTVVRGEPARYGKVVVGVDGSASSRAAVEYACREAQRRGCDVEAVTVWSRPRPTSPGDMLPLVYEPAAVEHQARQTLAEAVAPARAAHPNLVIDESAVHGRARRVLLDRSSDAALLVVGRHTHDFGSLGSVAGAVSHRAVCPVVVVPPGRQTGAATPA